MLVRCTGLGSLCDVSGRFELSPMDQTTERKTPLGPCEKAPKSHELCFLTFSFCILKVLTAFKKRGHPPLLCT